MLVVSEMRAPILSRRAISASEGGLSFGGGALKSLRATRLVWRMSLGGLGGSGFLTTWGSGTGMSSVFGSGLGGSGVGGSGTSGASGAGGGGTETVNSTNVSCSFGRCRLHARNTNGEISTRTSTMPCIAKLILNPRRWYSRGFIWRDR